MKNKTCSKCKTVKQITEFHRDNKTKDKLSFWCKSCAILKQKAYSLKNREKILEYHKGYNKKNRTKLSAYMKKYRDDNLERLKAYDKERIANLKKDVLGHYGGKCACCGESEIAFLSLDHINGDGAEERRKLFGNRSAGGSEIYRIIKQHNYPKGRYQVLCMNCNFAKGHNNNVCPHKK